MNEMNVSLQWLQWPERTGTVEQWRPWRVKCARVLEILADEGMVEGPERHTGSRTGDRFRDLWRPPLIIPTAAATVPCDLIDIP